MAENPVSEEPPLSPSSLHLYEAQFFRFTPQTCLVRLLSAFQDSLYEVLLAVEQVCARELGRAGSSQDQDQGQDQDQLRLLARECCRNLQEFMEERFRQASGRMEVLISRVLSVPPGVLLPDDQPHRKYPGGAEEAARLEAELAGLREEFRAEEAARQALRAELEEQGEAQGRLEELLAWVRELQGAWVREGVGSFNNSFQVVTQSLHNLQEVIAELGERSRLGADRE